MQESLSPMKFVSSRELWRSIFNLKGVFNELASSSLQKNREQFSWFHHHSMISSSLKPKSLPSFLHSSSSPSTFKWVSTKTPQASSPSPSLHHLRSLLTPKSPDQDLDYELSLISALKCCSTHLAISPGQQVHCFVVKSGFLSNSFVQNSLINLYSKCGLLMEAESIFHTLSRLDPVSCNILISGYMRSGKLGDACRMFDVMPKKGCVSYTTMILGFAQSGCWREVIRMFKEMRNVGGSVVPNEVTMMNVISACCHSGGGIWDCRLLHGLVVKMMLNVFVLVSTNLLHMYCVSLSLHDARALFDEMEERNAVSWNVMLNGYSKAGLIDLARDVFDKIPDKDKVSWGTIIDGYVRVEKLGVAFMMLSSMVSTGLRPNEVMMVDLVSACGRKLAIREGKQLHSVVVKTGFDCCDFIQATIIHFYAACGWINEARLQFEVGIKDHVASWNALISGFIRNGMIRQARRSFDEMPERDVFSWSAMISGYAQCGQPDEALRLFHQMVGTGIQANQVTMVSVFSAIATSGVLKEGRSAHEYVCKNSIPLHDNLSAAIIDMYAKCGSISDALEVFHQIRDKVSTVSPWNAIICGLAVNGHPNLALEVYSDLQRRGLKLNAITFIGILNACCHAGLVELGEKYFKSMKCVHSVDPDIRHYGCMVDLLGRAGRLEAAEETIRNMTVKADVMIWGMLLAACRTHKNVGVAERAAENLARLEPSHGASRVLLANIYADAGMWEQAFSVRCSMKSDQIQRLPGYSGFT